jgi:hypothetical protein
MPACPVAVRFTASAVLKAFVFFLRRSCRGAHFIGPWLVVDVRFDAWFETHGAAREPRGVGRFVGELGGVSRPEFGGLCFVVRQSLGGASRPDLADCHRCEAEGVA